MLLVFDTDISVDSGASSEFYFWTGQSRNSVNDVLRCQCFTAGRFIINRNKPSGSQTWQAGKFHISG